MPVDIPAFALFLVQFAHDVEMLDGKLAKADVQGVLHSIGGGWNCWDQRRFADALCTEGPRLLLPLSTTMG